MRFRRNRSLPADMPTKCFISHSYQDADAREKLLRILPKSVRPFIFPPIIVPPEQLVSNNLINAILDCDGLIYLTGGYSEQSFWVTFERDYALRAGKRVYSYDSATNRFERESTGSIYLQIFHSFSPDDKERVTKITSFMGKERFFNLWSVDHAYGLDLDLQLANTVADLLKYAYIAVFITSNALNDKYLLEELTYFSQTALERVLLILLEPTELPHSLNAFQKVQLYGDDQRSEIQRIDDLVVRLYWLIYHNVQNITLD